MTVYGIKIKSDIDIPLYLLHGTETRYKVELYSILPVKLQKSITCGFPLYLAHA